MLFVHKNQSNYLEAKVVFFFYRAVEVSLCEI